MRNPTVLIVSLLAVTPVPAADFRQIDALVQPLLDADAIVGCVVGVVDGDKKEVRGYGRVQPHAAEKPSGDTIYEIGSVTKAFTGTLLADMALRDELKLDAPLQDFLPSGVKLHLSDETPIRLVDLASQSSGLPRLPDNLVPKNPLNPYADYSSKQLFEFLGRYELCRPPGEYEYSNLGMGLLGTVLAMKAGQSYEQLVVDRICKPLRMADTRVTLSDNQRKRLAPPYYADLTPATNWDFDALAGAGAIKSTVNDLLKLVAASLGNDDQPVARAIHEAWKKRNGKPEETGVGLGWHILPDGTTIFHDGETAGYSSIVWIDPQKRLGVVVLCNAATDLTNQLGEKILQSVRGKRPEPIALQKEAKVDSVVLKSYEGTYVMQFIWAITVSLENGKLVAHLTNEDKFRLFAKSNTEFFCKVVPAWVSFEKGANGKVERLILHQNGIDTPCFKMRKPATAKP